MVARELGGPQHQQKVRELELRLARAASLHESIMARAVELGVLLP
jgi:hypothetical protein